MTDLNTGRYFADPDIAQFADALQRGNVARAEALLAAGVDANAVGASGFRPIFFALGATRPDALALILRAGADPNAALANGDVPLLFAVRKETADFTRLLLAAHADPNARASNDQPIIHEAILSDQPEHVRLLAAAGADLNVQWGAGSPVYGAAAALAWPMLVVLLELGASPAYADKAARTAGTILCETAARRREHGRDLSSLAAAHRALTRRGAPPPCSL